MNWKAALAQSAWAAGNLGASRRFAAALRDPRGAQQAWLARRLREDAESAFGRAHGFAGIASHAEYARRVPLRGWEEFAPWVERIRRGEGDVLARGRVTHLAPTSGSSGARKLIPFTRGLQRGFSEAVGAWMTDLVRRRPGLLGGPAYWSISPLADGEEGGAVRVGYADEADYLGGARAWLVRHALAAPASLRHERDMEVFWRKTLGCLLARRDLRLISVWHPTFVELLAAAAERNWAEVCDGLRDRERRAELRRIGPGDPARWWPWLAVVSCWGEQAAEPGWRRLRAMFPGAWVQAKGLLATEAAVTVPAGGAYPLAVTSHFFEFIDEGGGVRLAHELERGGRYEVVVTNGGGLWRYRLGDVVECTGRLAATPSLRFLGRAGNVSDLRGEKLSEAFVAEALAAVWPEGRGRPSAAFLRPSETGDGYELVVSSPVDTGAVGRLEAALSRNPHYALARRLGQLEAARVAVEAEAGAPAAARGIRLGDVKPAVLGARR